MKVVSINVSAPFTAPRRERAQAALDATEGRDDDYIEIAPGRYGCVFEVTRGLAKVCLERGSGSILGRLVRY